MKHVSTYFEHIYEGKKQYEYTLKVSKKFNLFDLLNELKPVGAEVLDGQPNGDQKDEMIVTIAMDDSKKPKVEDVIKKMAEIIKAA
jgi:hypothetical protein